MKPTRRLRFFARNENELPLCGHATIAAWSLLHSLDQVSAGRYTQQTKAGDLAVDVQADGLTFMEQAPAQFGPLISPAIIAPLLGISVEDFDNTLQPQIVSTGIQDLFVPLKNKATLAALHQDLDGIEAFSHQHGISAFHVFALLSDEASLASARNFAPIDDIPEECATGTSNGALLCYLREHGRLPERDLYRIEQGEAMGALSHIYGKFQGDRVWIGDHATVVTKRELEF